VLTDGRENHREQRLAHLDRARVCVDDLHLRAVHEDPGKALLRIAGSDPGDA
jgi:hypothetical protein